MTYDMNIMDLGGDLVIVKSATFVYMNIELGIKSIFLLTNTYYEWSQLCHNDLSFISVYKIR